MGVMRCDRQECEHIMCERCILHNSMYICNDCYGELVEYKKTWEAPMMAADVERKIRDFMETPPGTLRPVLPCDIDAEFERLTG